MVERILQCDIAVVGAGPAGLSAALAAASQGALVAIVDAQPTAGGQIWRHDVRFGAPKSALRLRAKASSVGVIHLSRCEAVAANGKRLLLNSDSGAITLAYDVLVVATGARELLLPFPGWTLPGVTGAGGAQALTKQGLPVQGHRVVVSGSGPLLLATAGTLKRHGARVIGIFEQAAREHVHAFAASLWRWPSKAVQALRLRSELAAVPYYYESHVLRALGGARLQAVELQRGKEREVVECDQLACGFGLVPNIEVGQLLSCDLQQDGRHAAIAVDDFQRTSVDGVLAAGEACGIGGVDCAKIEGTIAGLVAAGAPAAARRYFERRNSARRFAALLSESFALRDAVKQLADKETLVCRCEDVRYSDLTDHYDARAAKLNTRCGMGACQGRVCGPAFAEIFGFSHPKFRPPVFPLPLNALAALQTEASADQSQGAMQ